MSCVVFAFATADGLSPVVGAAPFDVLARQLPRLLVARLNGAGDRGVRFFPFLGPVGGRRAFLQLREPLDPGVLRRIHKQGDVALLADGCLHQDRVAWRVLDARTGEARLVLELPFDAARPLDVLPRMEFELVSLLGWTGRPSAAIALRGPALGWYLVLKDELLRHEANLPAAPGDALRAASACVETAPDDDDVQRLLLDFFALLLRRGQHRDGIAGLVRALAPAVDGPERLERLGGLALAAGDQPTAAALAVRAALDAPERAELAERAAAMAFRAGDDAAVRRVVHAAREARAATPSLLAQLAASCDRTGDRETRAALVEELCGHDDLPVPVARLVVSFLLEEDEPALARGVAEAALRKAPDQAMLHFEVGRAALLLDDGAAASVALQRALDLGLAAGLREQARRLLRLSLVPGLWNGIRGVEQQIERGALDEARAAARAVVRRAPRVAEAWLMLGIVEQKLGRLRRAERVLRRAVLRDAGCAEAHNRLGVVLLQRGSVGEGAALLERAHALAPDDTSTLLHLAQARALPAGAHRRPPVLVLLAETRDLVVVRAQDIVAVTAHARIPTRNNRRKGYSVVPSERGG